MLHSSSIFGEKEVMASKVLTILQDDLDGSDAKETVHFAIDGVEYEIDLSDRNANRLRNSLRDFTTHGRRVGGRAKRGTGSTKTSTFDGVDNKAVRAWAKAAGVEVSSRGRIPAEVVSAYRAAGN
jgi:hypothetical protein